MTSFSSCFFVVSMVVWFQLLLGFSSTMASTKYIDTICNNTHISNKAFCFQTLTAYPPAVSATNQVELVKVVVDLVLTHAKETTVFVVGLGNEPTFTKYFKVCNEAFTSIVGYLRSAQLEIEDKDPKTASHHIVACFDKTTIVKNEVGKNTDNASKTLMEKTLVMENFIEIAVGAVNSI